MLVMGGVPPVIPLPSCPSKFSVHTICANAVATRDTVIMAVMTESLVAVFIGIFTPINMWFIISKKQYVHNNYKDWQ